MGKFIKELKLFGITIVKHSHDMSWRGDYYFLNNNGWGWMYCCWGCDFVDTAKGFYKSYFEIPGELK